jgi:hypothetical protein
MQGLHQERIGVGSGKKIARAYKDQSGPNYHRTIAEKAMIRLAQMDSRINLNLQRRRAGNDFDDFAGDSGLTDAVHVERQR